MLKVGHPHFWMANHTSFFGYWALHLDPIQQSVTLQEAGLRVIIACRNELLAKQAADTLGCEYEILDAWICLGCGKCGKQALGPWDIWDALVDYISYIFPSCGLSVDISQ